MAAGASWTYDANRIHAVAQAGNASVSYSYDANGNVSARNGATVSWTSYNHPSVITGVGGESVQFAYNQDHLRWSAISSGSTGVETTYFVGSALEKVVTVGASDYRHYIYAGGTKVAIYSRMTNGTNTLRYVREDHQSSVSAILASDGTTYVKESFTAFGLRRSACTWSGLPTNGTLTKINAVTRHGYTWQTVLGSLGLNDMNGRIQDAVTGRFLSPDPSVSKPGFTQSYNRYSYVNNNPLSFVDPSGFIPHRTGLDGGAGNGQSGDGSSGSADGSDGGNSGGNGASADAGAMEEVTVTGSRGGSRGEIPPVSIATGSIVDDSGETVEVNAKTPKHSATPPQEVPLPVVTVTAPQNQQTAANPPWKRSPRLPCTWCGAPHGGTYGPYCPDCNKKSQDPDGGVPPNPSLPDPDPDKTPLPNLDDPAPMQVPQLPWLLLILEGVLA